MITGLLELDDGRVMAIDDDNASIANQYVDYGIGAIHGISWFNMHIEETRMIVYKMKKSIKEKLKKINQENKESNQ